MWTFAICYVSQSGIVLIKLLEYESPCLVGEVHWSPVKVKMSLKFHKVGKILSQEIYQ